MKNLKDKIIDTTSNLFLTMGIKNVTMDQICNSLSISKRTLYEIFDDKDSLIKECIINIFLEHNKNMLQIIEKQDNIFDAMIEIFDYQIVKARNMPEFIIDNLKSYSAKLNISVSIIIEKTQGKWIPFMVIERGIKQGFFRKDINVKVVNFFLQELIMSVHDKNLFSNKQFTKKDVKENILFPYIRGLCSEKGLKMMDDKIDTIRRQMEQYCV